MPSTRSASLLSLHQNLLTGLQRPSEVRQQLEQSQMPVDDAPEDDAVRQTYNFAPGSHGLVYRADGPDPGNDSNGGKDHEHGVKAEQDDATVAAPAETHKDTKYKLQAMKWGEHAVFCWAVSATVATVLTGRASLQV